MFLSLRQQENALVTVPSNGMSVINISHVSESKTFFHSVFAFQICVKSWTEFYTSELRYSLISFWCCCSRPDQVTNVTTHRFSSRKLPFLFPAVRGNTKWPELVLGCRTMWNVQLLGHSHRILWAGKEIQEQPHWAGVKWPFWERQPEKRLLFHPDGFKIHNFSIFCASFITFFQECVANTKAVTEGLVPHSPLGLQLSFPRSPQGNPILHEPFVEQLQLSPQCREVATCLQGHFPLG